MPVVSPLFSLLLVLTTTAPAPTESAPVPECGPLLSRIDLHPESSWKVGPVCIGARVATTFLFDTPLKPHSVVLQQRERFGALLLGERGVTLVSLQDLEPGERFQLVVEFADEQAPRRVEFLLVVHPARATRQVEVYRHARPCEELLVEAQARVQQLTQEVARLDAELKRVRAMTGAPGNLGDLLTSNFLAPGQGLAEQAIDTQLTLESKSTLKLEGARSFRAGPQAALWLALLNSGTQDWEAAGGILVGPEGEVEVKVQQAEAIAPGARQPVIVVPLAPGVKTDTRYELKLWDASGKRVVALGQISFP
jgi:uncharacterized protein (TIGR02268 family)